MPDGIQLAVHKLLPFLVGGGVYLVMVFLGRIGMFLPRPIRLQRKGLDLLLEGKPAEAEKYYRAALNFEPKVPKSDQVRLLVCLGDSLIDQGRFDEAKQSLTQALEIGDPTGSGQGSMCDVLLALKQTSEKVIEIADEAKRLHESDDPFKSFGDKWAEVAMELYDAIVWSRKAQALILLDRREEARQAIDRALRILEASESAVGSTNPSTSITGRLMLGNRLQRMKHLVISGAHWHVGLALLALNDKAKAAEHFQIVCDADLMGKYRKLAQEQLSKLGYK